MTQHWNIQINIQRVEEVKSEPVQRGTLPVKNDRSVIEVLKLAVTADSEAEAYLKAHRMLTANESFRE